MEILNSDVVKTIYISIFRYRLRPNIFGENIRLVSHYASWTLVGNNWIYKDMDIV